MKIIGGGGGGLDEKKSLWGGGLDEKKIIAGGCLKLWAFHPPMYF